MRLDRGCPAPELQDLVVAEDERGAFFVARVDELGARLARARVDHLAGLGAEHLLDDRPPRRSAQERLEHLVFVRVVHALHDGLAEPPGGIDQDAAGKPGLARSVNSEAKQRLMASSSGASPRM